MADPTTTRRNLRRAVCRANGFRFHRQFSTSMGMNKVELINEQGINKHKITNYDWLVHPKNTWKGAWMLILTGNSAGHFRRVGSSDPAETALITEMRFFGSHPPQAGDRFELLDWSPQLVHDAINRAIRDGYRAFPYVTDDKSIVLQENKLEYDLSHIAEPIWIPVQVWLERKVESETGTITGGSLITLVDTNKNWVVNEHIGKLVSAYSGNSSIIGQYRRVTSNTNTTLTVSPQWNILETPRFSPGGTRTSFEGSYRLWNPNVQSTDWYRLPAGRFFPEENPSEFSLTRLYPDLYGLRMRIVYMPGPVTLEDDDDTTRINSEYITYKASSILHDMLVSDSSVNRSAHASIAEYYDRLARDILERHRKAVPPFNMWVEEDSSMAGYDTSDFFWRP